MINLCYSYRYVLKPYLIKPYYTMIRTPFIDGVSSFNPQVVEWILNGE